MTKWHDFIPAIKACIEAQGYPEDLAEDYEHPDVKNAIELVGRYLNIMDYKPDEVLEAARHRHLSGPADIWWLFQFAKYGFGEGWIKTTRADPSH
jgi:hypothetical protein